MNIRLILDNIRSLQNVGSIFRTADGFGVEKIYLVGATGHPHPDSPWRKDHLTLVKTALGAEKSVPWVHRQGPIKVIEELKSDGYKIISLEQTSESLPITAWHQKDEKLALVVGHEVDGVSQDFLTASEKIIHIPMMGTKESFNVSVAVAIALYHLAVTK